MIPPFLLHIMIVFMPLTSVEFHARAQSPESNHSYCLSYSACHENTCNRFVNGLNRRLQGNIDDSNGDQIVRLACGSGTNLLSLTVFGEMQSRCGLYAADHDKSIAFRLNVAEEKFTYQVRKMSWADIQLSKPCSRKCPRSSVQADTEMTCILSEVCIRHADTYESKVRLLGCDIRENVYGSVPRNVNGHFCESVTMYLEKLTSHLGKFEQIVLECARVLPTGFSLTVNTQWSSVYLANVNSAARSEVSYVYITNGSLSLSNHITFKTKNVDIFMDKAVTNTTFLTAIIALRSLPLTANSYLKCNNKERLEDTLNSDIVIVACLDPRQKTLSHPVDLVLVHRKRADHSRCVFWEESTCSWSDHGCRVLRVNRTHTHCTCLHLSSFAILLSLNDSYHQSPEEMIVSYIGSVVSTVCLLITLWTFSVMEGLKNRRTFIHKNIVGCLLAGHIVFLAGINQTDTLLICEIIAVLLHAMFLSLFTWMFLEGVFIYVTLLHARNNFCFTVNTVVLCFFGYGIPSLICFMTVLVMGDDYLVPERDICWMNGSTRWTLIGPVVFVIIVNTFVFAVAVFLMCKHSIYTGIQRSIPYKLKMWIRGAAMMINLLGISWILELFHFSNHSVFYSVVIAIASSFQGFFIFLFCCLLDKKISSKYLHLLLRLGCLPKSILSVLPTREIGSQDDNRKAEFNFYNRLLGWEKIESHVTLRKDSVPATVKSLQSAHSNASESWFQSLFWSPITFFRSFKKSVSGNSSSHSSFDEEPDEVMARGTTTTVHGPWTPSSRSQAHNTNVRKNKWRYILSFLISGRKEKSPSAHTSHLKAHKRHGRKSTLRNFVSFLTSGKKEKGVSAHTSHSKAHNRHGSIDKRRNDALNLSVEPQDSGRKVKVQQSVIQKVRDLFVGRKETNVTEEESKGKGGYLTNDPVNNRHLPDSVQRSALDFLFWKRGHEDHAKGSDKSTYSGSADTAVDDHVKDFDTRTCVYCSTYTPDMYVNSSQEV